MDTPQKPTSSSASSVNTPTVVNPLFFDEYIVPAPFTPQEINKKKKGGTSSGEESEVTPKIKVPWTPEEDEILRKAVEQYKGRGWKQVAELLPGRTHSQAAHRWQKVLDPKLKKGSWTIEEDEQLQKAVEEIGQGHWSRVAERVATRNGKQCRERWRNQISPEVDKRPWLSSEDEGIIRLFNQLGPKWAEIAKHFPGRTENAVKNRWNAKLGRPHFSHVMTPGTPQQRRNGAAAAETTPKTTKSKTAKSPASNPSPLSTGPSTDPLTAAPSTESSAPLQAKPPLPPPRKRMKQSNEATKSTDNQQMDATQALLALRASQSW